DLTITGPTLSSLDVEFAYTTQRPNSPVTQIDPRQRAPGEVALAKEVGVTMTDDGTTRTWIVQVTVSTCAEFRQLQFFNRGSPGPRKRRAGGLPGAMARGAVRRVDPAAASRLGRGPGPRRSDERATREQLFRRRRPASLRCLRELRGDASAEHERVHDLHRLQL